MQFLSKFPFILSKKMANRNNNFFFFLIRENQQVGSIKIKEMVLELLDNFILDQKVKFKNFKNFIKFYNNF